MRISDWSSDVCSSDLLERLDSGEIAFDRLVIECTGLADPAPVAQTFFIDEELDRKGVVLGKSVSVRVDHGGSRIIKKKTRRNILRQNRITTKSITDIQRRVTRSDPK